MSGETIKIPDNIPISWLPNHPELDSEMLFLISVPSTKTETGFISKYITFRDLKNGLQSLFQIDTTYNVIEQISGDYFPILDSLSSNTICCNIENPYIISSIVQRDGNICEVGGYRLSTMIDKIHQEVAVDTLKAKKIEIAGWGGNNPLKSLYGYKIIDHGLNLNINVSHHTLNCSYPSGGTSKIINVYLEDITASAKEEFSDTQFEFKLYVDNTRLGTIASHTVNWNTLGAESLKGTIDDVTIVGVNERCLFTVQRLGIDGPFFIDKKILTSVL